MTNALAKDWRLILFPLLGLALSHDAMAAVFFSGMSVLPFGK